MKSRKASNQGALLLDFNEKKEIPVKTDEAASSPKTGLRMRTMAEMSWALKRWGELNIPWWQKIYHEAVAQQDERRAGYAKNLLKELGVEV